MNIIWDKVHSEREWGIYPNEHLVRWACGRFKTGAQQKVLDLGCGQGSSTLFLAREGFDVSAIDFSHNAVAKCNKRLRAEKLKARVFVGEMMLLPFQSGYFDGVVDVVSSAHNTKAHIELIYKEAARVLKVNGTLFLITPTNSCSRRPFMEYGTISFMESEEIKHILEKNFTNIKIRHTSYEIDDGCEVRNWVVTADRKAAQGEG